MGITNLNFKSKMKVSTLTTILVLCLVSSQLAESLRSLKNEEFDCQGVPGRVRMDVDDPRNKGCNKYWHCIKNLTTGEVTATQEECGGGQMAAPNDDGINPDDFCSHQLTPGCRWRFGENGKMCEHYA